jgi:hypothetical protein
MREKLNENPVAQIAVVAVLLIAAGFLLMSSLGGGESEAPAPEAGTVPPAETESSATAPVEGVEEAGSLEGAAPAAATSSASAPAPKPLPHPVQEAYEHGETIALLIYRPGGVEDRHVTETASVFDEMPGVAFFAVPASEIVRYAEITGPLGVNQAPALIVVRRRSLNDGAPAPATVTYGFQSASDLRQAVVDSGYRGPQLTYAPN